VALQYDSTAPIVQQQDTFAESDSINASVSGEWMADRRFSTQADQFRLRFQIVLLLPQTVL
jgi:hypothetical protein